MTPTNRLDEICDLLSRASPIYYLSICGLQQPASQPAGDMALQELIQSDTDAILERLVNTSSAISSRLEIHEQQTTEIDYSYMYVRSALCQLQASVLTVRDEDAGDRPKQRDSLLAMLADLAKEKRELDVTCWRDLLEPNQAFLSTVHEFRQIESERRLFR